MSDILEWDGETQTKQFQQFIEDNSGLIFDALGISYDATIDYGGDEVVTIMWDEDDPNGPSIILLEECGLTISSGNISVEDEVNYKNSYREFMNSYK